MLSHLSDLFFIAGVNEDNFDFEGKREDYILKHTKLLNQESMTLRFFLFFFPLLNLTYRNKI